MTLYKSRKCLPVYMAFVLLLLPCLGCMRKPVEKNTNLNIILITIDAARADHIGAYGYRRETSPNVDRIAKNGVLFENCYSHASWTLPSMISMFTSILPVIHGNVRAQIESKKIIYQEVLSDDFETLPEFMKSAGYTTAGFSTNGHLIRKEGFAQGFDYYDEECLWENAECVNEKAISWLENNHDKKFFMWVHYIDAHADHQPGIKGRYNPPEKYKEMFKVEGDPMGKEVSEALYDGEIRHCDDVFGELLKEFEKYGILENSVIVITSDHGESFMEHGKWYHADNVYRELIHVPFIISYPPLFEKGKKIDTVVSHIDLLPTLLEIAGINPASRIEGKSLVPLLEGKGNKWEDKSVYCETRKYDGLDLRTIILDNYQYILNYKDGMEELYNMADDPLETKNLINEKKILSAEMRKILEHEVSTKEKLAKKPLLVEEMEKERIEKLRLLGYIK
ncbi:MAG: sulfatase [Candidatus Schekmanbacteria bacterium]|nr:sulfatase [Candidatus Schekmanbacteria bacterium]